MPQHNTYLSLGTNLGNREQNIQTALTQLNQIGRVTHYSSYYYNDPWGYTSPNQYLNIAAQLTTNLTPTQLLTALQTIETNMGRQHKTTNSQYTDRPIDIDILLYDNLTINTPTLTIPHPHLHQRQFALQTLAEIAPDTIHPTIGKTITQLLHDLTTQ